MVGRWFVCLWGGVLGLGGGVVVGGARRGGKSRGTCGFARLACMQLEDVVLRLSQGECARMGRLQERLISGQRKSQIAIDRDITTLANGENPSESRQTFPGSPPPRISFTSPVPQRSIHPSRPCKLTSERGLPSRNMAKKRKLPTTYTDQMHRRLTLLARRRREITHHSRPPHQYGHDRILQDARAAAGPSAAQLLEIRSCRYVYFPSRRALRRLNDG